MTDAINPSHYKQGSIEFIDALEIVLTPEEFRGFLKGNAMKYLWREKKKQGIEDLRKAKWYLDRLVNEPGRSLAEGLVGVWLPSDKPPRRYREPTLADLANGPIECEVRDCDIEAWRYATLQQIIPGDAYEYRVRKRNLLFGDRYAQCRIEVQE